MGVVPQILSFLGSRKLLALSQVNTDWRRTVLSEETWHTLCVDTGKWKDGDPTPHSWFELYRNSPCVPIDYNTVESALASVTAAASTNNQVNDNGGDGGSLQESKVVRILLRPAEYVLNDSLVIDTTGSITQITIETLEDFSCSTSMDDAPIVASLPIVHSSDFSHNRGNHRRKLFALQKLQNRFESVRRKLTKSSCLPTAMASSNATAMGVDAFVPTFPADLINTNGEQRQQLRRAKLILKTRKQNKPLIYVQEGLLHLKNIDLCHYSSGTDIWRGNAALQLQPLLDTQGIPSTTVIRQPTAILNNVDVMSQSGRGIVAIDGGRVIARKCRIHHCAATGLFVAGLGSEATVEDCDIVSNGVGNRLSSRGVAPGHSGIFVSQGYARVINSNVSHNSLTGISPAQSMNNSEVQIVNSTLIGNGTMTTTTQTTTTAAASWNTNNRTIGVAN